MLTGVFVFLLAVVLNVTAYPQDFRYRRASSGSSSSSSYSSSGSSSGGGGGSYQGGGNYQGYPGGDQGGFAFPNQYQGGYGYPSFDFNILFQQYLASLAAAHAYAAQNAQFASTVFKEQLMSLAEQHKAAMAQYPFAFPLSNAIGPEAYGSNGNPVYTSASASLGPQGGFGQASAAPGGPDGLGVRIAQEFPAPSGGGSFGTFTSSSSGTSDVNGKRTSFKTSTFGTNDNGKITFRTVNE